MEFDEFKQQFRARRQQAQWERDNLSRSAEDTLRKAKFLVQLTQNWRADVKAGQFSMAKKKLQEQGFDDVGLLTKETNKLLENDIFVKIEKLEDELNRQTAICPQCNGRCYIAGRSEWVEEETGRMLIQKIDLCLLCEGKGKFAVDKLLHC